jgi:tRNA threonylcarbamoyladenosine biosynthesis protein TsaE
VRLSADDLNAFGERLGRELPPGSVVGLSGDLGTGKTTLVQAICRGLGASVPATSPTYALVHRYSRGNDDRSPVYHVDCYRLRRAADAVDLGFDDMIREKAVVLIEWPERAGTWAPKLDRRIRLAFDPDPGYRHLEAT